MSIGKYTPLQECESGYAPDPEYVWEGDQQCFGTKTSIPLIGVLALTDSGMPSRWFFGSTFSWRRKTWTTLEAQGIDFVTVEMFVRVPNIPAHLPLNRLAGVAEMEIGAWRLRLFDGEGKQ